MLSLKELGKMKRSSVFLLIVGTEGYGVRRGLIGIAKDLQRRGIAVTVAALEEGGTVDALRKQGLQVTVAPRVARPAITRNPLSRAFAYFRRWIGQLSLVPWLAAQIRKSGAKNLIVRSPPELLLAGMAAKKAGASAFWLMPAGISDHYPANLNRRIYDFIIRHAAIVPIANSRFTAGTLGSGAGKVYVSHLGVDPEEFRLPEVAERDAVRSSLGIPGDAVVLGLLARLTPNKGQLVFTRALAELGRADVHLLICGGPMDSAYAAGIAELAAARGLAETVHLVGPVDDVARYYAACDVVVSSRIDPEPFGFSVIEAMIMGRLVLAHAAGGPGETVIDGMTGWLVEQPTPAGFRQGLERMLADRAKWDDMASEARRHALTNFTNTAMTGRLLQIMDEHTGQRAPSAPSSASAQVS